MTTPSRFANWLLLLLFAVVFGFVCQVYRVIDFIKDGKADFPISDYRHAHRGVASWYKAKGLVCATNLFPKGTVVRVTHGRLIVYVTVVGRGPAWWRRRFSNRVVDLSKDAFRALANPDKGLIFVTLEAVR